MTSFEKQYTKLEKKVRDEYFKLVHNLSEDIYIGHFENPISVKDEIMGGNYSVIPLKFKTDGKIRAVDYEDSTAILNYSFDDIEKLIDKINVVDYLEKVVLDGFNNIIK